MNVSEESQLRRHNYDELRFLESAARRPRTTAEEVIEYAVLDSRFIQVQTAAKEHPVGSRFS